MRYLISRIAIILVWIFCLYNSSNAQSFDDKYYLNGLSLATQGKLDEAGEFFNKSLQLDSDRLPAQKALRILTDLSNNKISAKAAVGIFKGVDYRTKGELDNAISELDEALVLSPGYAPTYNERGFAYYRRGNYDLAVSDFNKAVEIEPDFTDAYYNRGITYYLDHQYKKALVDIEKAQALGRRVDANFMRDFKQAAAGE